jgi:hypothetical protein
LPTGRTDPHHLDEMHNGRIDAELRLCLKMADRTVVACLTVSVGLDWGLRIVGRTMGATVIQTGKNVQRRPADGNEPVEGQE